MTGPFCGDEMNIPDVHEMEFFSMMVVDPLIANNLFVGRVLRIKEDGRDCGDFEVMANTQVEGGFEVEMERVR